MRLDELDQRIVELFADLGGQDGFEWRAGKDEIEIEIAPMPTVDECRKRTLAPDQKAGNLFDRFLRRRQTDSLDPSSGETLEPLKREREVRSALIPSERVDLVDDDGFDALEKPASPFTCQENEERFGRGDEEVGMLFEQLRTLVCGGIPRPDRDAKVKCREALLGNPLEDALNGVLEVFGDIDAERLEWRDVKDAELIAERSIQAVADEPIDCGHERGEGLPRTRRCGDEDILTPPDGRPRLKLRRAWRTEALFEPARDGGVKEFKHHHWTY